MLRIFRLPNLFIIFLTQYVLQYGILYPAYSEVGVKPELDHIHFFSLSFCTALIAASGYVINDLEDYEIDLINKPERMVVGKEISSRAASRLYWTMNIGGLLLALYLAIHVQAIGLVLLFPGAVALLYLYSKYFKKQLLIGNLLVAIFCAFVAGIVWFAERHSFILLHKTAQEKAVLVAVFFIFYMAFGFLSTWFREIVKDLEDIEGDRRLGCKTLPIFYGKSVAKAVATAIGLSLFLLLCWWGFSGIAFLGFITKLFLITGVAMPLAYNLLLVIRANEKADYRAVSRMAKYVMLSGLLLLLVYVFEKIWII